jgi:hypothetical protein
LFPSVLPYFLSFFLFFFLSFLALFRQFYLDDFLNDDAMIELVRADDGSEVGLLHSLQSCYCTFFYEMDREDMDEQAQKDARRQLEQDRKKRQEMEEARKLKMLREVEEKHTEKARALEKQKAELRAILKHEKAQYKLLKEQGLVSELVDEVGEDVETGRLPHETIKEAQLRHIRALSKLSVAGYGDGQSVAFGDIFDDEMLEKKESSSPTIKSLKGTLDTGADDVDMGSAMDAAMQSAMDNVEGDMAVPPSEGEEMDRKIEDKTESGDGGETKEVKSPWEDTDNYIVYDVEARGKDMPVKGATTTGNAGHAQEEEDEDNDLDEIRVLWDLEVNDREAEGGVGWTEVLATRFRHDDSPHGSVFLTVDSTEQAVLGWISLSAHDCRLKGVVDEDSHELYDCVNEGLLLDRRTATVSELTPIQEADEEVENAAIDSMLRPSPSKFQRQEENFDEDDAGAGGGGDEEEADLSSARSTKEEKIEQLKEEAGLSKLQQLQKQARENRKKLMEEKLSKIEIGNGNKPPPDDGIPVEEETLGNIGSADERQREEEAGMSKLQRLQKQARENRKKLMEEKLSKIEIGGDNNKSTGDGVEEETLGNSRSAARGVSDLKRLQMQARANIKKSVDDKLKNIEIGDADNNNNNNKHSPSKPGGLSQKEDDTPAKLIKKEPGPTKSEEPDATPPIKAKESDLEEEDLDL